MKDNDFDPYFEESYQNTDPQIYQAFLFPSPEYPPPPSLTTEKELNSDFPKTYKQTNNPNNDRDIDLKGNSEQDIEKKIGKMVSNKKRYNKNIFKYKNYNSTTNKTTKTLGRRTKASTETGGHTAQAKDNLIEKCWRDFFKKYIFLCNYYSKLYGYTLKKTNFKKQFGSSIIRNRFFINIKMYQYLTYDPPINPSHKFHRQFGKYNFEVITEMLKKNNKFFNALMGLNIKTVYNKYINNDKNLIINGIDYFLFEFQTIDDVIEEKVKNKEENIDAYKKRAINLIKYIIEEGENIMRKEELNEKEKINYLSIEELD